MLSATARIFELPFAFKFASPLGDSAPTHDPRHGVEQSQPRRDLPLHLWCHKAKSHMLVSIYLEMKLGIHNEYAGTKSS